MLPPQKTFGFFQLCFLLEVTLQQTFQAAAMTGLVAGHLISIFAALDTAGELIFPCYDYYTRKSTENQAFF